MVEEGRQMVRSWSSWKNFPNAQSGGHIEAPIGPGVYEVRHTTTGQLVAFGHSANVANSISDLKFDKQAGSWTRLFRRSIPSPRESEMEYRTYAAASQAEAKAAVQRLRGLRQNYWRQRTVHDWIGGTPA